MTPISNGNMPSRFRLFRQNLQELADVLKDYTADGSRVLFVFHPHIQHLKPDASGRRGTISSAPRCRKWRRQQFLFFNATATLKARFGRQPEKFYWRSDDMHYDFEGMQEYSAAVAAFMAKTMINPKDSVLHP